MDKKETRGPVRSREDITSDVVKIRQTMQDVRMRLTLSSASVREVNETVLPLVVSMNSMIVELMLDVRDLLEDIRDGECDDVAGGDNGGA